MIRAPRPLLALVLLLPTLGCSERPPQSAELFVFGTLVEVQLPDASPREAADLFAALQAEFQRMHHDWHAWEPGALVELNQAFASGEWAETTPEIIDILHLARDMEQRSGGRFNAAIGRLIALWGFHTSDYPIIGPPPTAEHIQAELAARPSALDLQFRVDAVRSSNPAVQIDLGGIAKGYAVDIAIDMIREAGQSSAVVNAGGDLRAIGNKRGQPWRIAVRRPGGGGTDPIAGTIEVEGDYAVFTSGVDTRFRQDAGERYPHILDPRTGWPVQGISSVTVVTRQGAIADAAATALIVAGPQDWPRVADAMGVDSVLVIDEQGAMLATPEMMKHFTPLEASSVGVVLPGD